MAFGGGGISCTIRNLSQTGACLEVISPVGIPEHFVLMIEADQFSRSCKIMWRKETRIGVTFDDVPAQQSG
jgi:hypothetical protein